MDTTSGDNSGGVAVKGQTSKILCCYCGVLIDPNPLNTCLECIQSKIDITEGIIKQGLLQYCNKCERYLQPPNTWLTATLESRQLLSICLKRIKGLNKIHLVDAGFIWTEPHSKRVKVKLTVQKDVSGAMLQQTTVIEFTVVNQICQDCQRVEAKDYWKAVVQVRQRVEHKKTFYYLEQLILKLNMHQNTVSIKQVSDGIDFFYANQQDARKMIDFFESVVPCRYNTSKRLISHDIHSNTYNYKYTYSLEIVPICKDNIVCLPAKLSKENGSIGPICVCTRVTKVIQLIDPRTLKVLDVDANTYWRYPFLNICTPKQYRDYIIMDIEKLDSSDRPYVYGKESSKHELADAWVMKANEMGKSENQTHTKTHLGHLLNIGDLALGFDLANANINDSNYDLLNTDNLPDVVLVKKIFADKSKRHKQRKWRLKRLAIEKEESIDTIDDKDYLDFLEDLEEDPKIRENVNIYKDAKKKSTAVEVNSNDDEDKNIPVISLEEMLDDLTIQDEPMET